MLAFGGIPAGVILLAFNYPEWLGRSVSQTLELRRDRAWLESGTGSRLV
jgi:hypothetical protein